jgi:hypothetical protein
VAQDLQRKQEARFGGLNFLTAVDSLQKVGGCGRRQSLPVFFLLENMVCD